ncbi:MAG: NAD-dependent epimerase/dehydratase family protein [Propionivibrio sp.]|nr:NAD-dependent epimerase/dehydratase family protein [Propionivibrio sp.]
MNDKVLVTGGAGFIGSHLARALLAEGHAVTILDDLSMGKEENIPVGASFIQGDVRSQEDVRRAILGAGIVFHEAARVSIRASVKEFYEDADTNFMGTLNLLKCCSKSDVRKFVFASSMAVYADSASPNPIAEDYTTEPISPYGIAKLAAEKYCMQLTSEMGIGCHILRYFNTYGPGQTYTPYVGVITIFIRQLLQGQSPRVFGDGEQRRDFVHVSDIIAANLLSMKSPLARGIFNVGTGKATSVNDIASLLCRRIDPQCQPCHADAHPGELRNSIADIRSISAALGYRPAAALPEKIGEVIEFYRKGTGNRGKQVEEPPERDRSPIPASSGSGNRRP